MTLASSNPLLTLLVARSRGSVNGSTAQPPVSDLGSKRSKRQAVPPQRQAQDDGSDHPSSVCTVALSGRACRTLTRTSLAADPSSNTVNSGGGERPGCGGAGGGEVAAVALVETDGSHGRFRYSLVHPA